MNLARKIDALFSARHRALIDEIRAAATSDGCRIYLVGGVVRDLLLGRRRRVDLDIVVEGDAIGLGERLGRRLGAGFVAYRRFGTASVICRDGTRVDLAGARTETYAHPGALPAVTFAALRHDLYRRDFTINAMAVSLDRTRYGELVDFFGGRDDLRRGIIRVLHEASFTDDPTRLLRAFRFRCRFGFRIDRQTARLLRQALAGDPFARISGPRLRNELERILAEEDAVSCLRAMAKAGLLRALDPRLKFDRRTARLCTAAGRVCRRYAPSAVWLVRAMALTASLKDEAIRHVGARLVFTRADRDRLVEAAGAARKALHIIGRSAILPSTVHEVLTPLSREVVLFMLALSDCVPSERGRRIRARIQRFLIRDSKVTVAIGGDDLVRLGLTPSPHFKKILTAVRAAKIDGKIRTRREELILAARFASRAQYMNRSAIWRRPL